MNNIPRELFRAIHEGYWLYIEYRNKKEETTKYWISIKALDPINRRIAVDGMHMKSYEIKSLNLFIDSILSAKVIEGTYAPLKFELIEDIRINPEKYYSVFSDVANLKILNYLSHCNKLDQTPYKTSVTLIEHLDDQILGNNNLELTNKQFDQIVKGFQKNTNKNNFHLQTIELGLNLLSINHTRGIYVLAYQPLRLDVENRKLKASGDIVICTEFSIDGEKQSVRQFMDPEDL